MFTLMIQISILKEIYLRSQEPENFHYNFFGKKVLHPSVVKPSFLLAFLFSMPFLLLAGAYFVARLINIFLFGHL
jgi:demethoxyubiquinone hydroxylase (CLK1/Coq7/Cat5 family)